MSNHIEKDSPNRWFYVKTDAIGVNSLICFGYGGEQFQSIVESGSFLLNAFLSETELEAEVNIIADEIEYYKLSVETNNGKFLYPSGIYTEIEPPQIEE